jgi:AcrR family transcriptional regulator/DNA-binding MarR family transcriptional regulator
MPSRSRLPRSIGAGDRPKLERAGCPGGADRVGGRGGVAAIQRTRLIVAMAQVVRERGIGATTVADVVSRSGVSRRTFYELFADRDDCFRGAFDHAIERAGQRVVPAHESAHDWRERMRAGLTALLEFLDDEPDLGALCVVDALGAGPVGLARRAEVVRLLVAAVDEGRLETVAGARPTGMAAEGVVGAVLSVLHARLACGGPSAESGEHRGARDERARGKGPRDGTAPGGRAQADQASMTSLLAPLMAMVVLPYQGQDAATREAARRGRRRRPSQPRDGDPLKSLDMRVTYRTVQVLRAIAASPQASNRQIADAAGIADPGQISKLLSRLEQVGLIRNEIAAPYRGEPNAWSLTARGEELERSILRDAVAPDDQHERTVAVGRARKQRARPS